MKRDKPRKIMSRPKHVAKRCDLIKEYVHYNVYCSPRVQLNCKIYSNEVVYCGQNAIP